MSKPADVDVGNLSDNLPKSQKPKPKAIEIEVA